jgi:hypothetical protein
VELSSIFFVCVRTSYITHHHNVFLLMDFRG